MQEIYEGKKADGSIGYYTPGPKGDLVEIPKPVDLNAEIGNVVEGTKKRWESQGTLLPRFDLKESTPTTYPFKLTGNAIAQLLDTIPSAVVGTGQLLANGWDIAKAIKEDATTNTTGGTVPSLAKTFNNIGQSTTSDFINERFTREGFEKNPLTIPLDIASIAAPMLKGKGITGLASKLKGAARTGAIEHYAGNVANESLHIPELNIKNPSTAAEAINYSKSIGMEAPTIGQMTRNPAVVKSELFSPGIGAKVQKQNEGITNALQTFLEQPSLNGTSNQITLAHDTSQATGIIRDSIVKNIKKMQASLTAEINGYIREMQAVTGSKDLKAAEKLLSIDRKSPGFTALSPEMKGKYARLQTLREQRDATQKQLSSLIDDRLTKTVTSSKNLMKSGAPAPINYNPNADFTKMIDEAFTSPQKFRKFVQTPGVGKENGAQLLIFKLANKAKVKDTEFFDPGVLADLLTNKDNAAMLRDVLPANKRVGIQSMAYTLRKYATYSPAELEAMAFSLNRAKDTAMINVAGAAVPSLLGGNFAQMRAGYGLVQGGYLKLKGNVLGQLLISEPWLMDAIAKTPKNSPALGSRVKQLVKAMGQLHLPAVFEINGQEVEIAPENPN